MRTSESTTETENVLVMALYRRRNEKIEKGGTTNPVTVFQYVDAAMYSSTEPKFSNRFLCEKVVHLPVPCTDYGINEAQVIYNYEGGDCRRSEEASMKNESSVLNILSTKQPSLVTDGLTVNTDTKMMAKDAQGRSLGIKKRKVNNELVGKVQTSVIITSCPCARSF